MTRRPTKAAHWLLRRLPLFGGRVRVAVPAGLALAILALGLRLALEPVLPGGFPYVTFFPAMLLAVTAFGLWGGISCGLSGFFLARWFFVEPFHSLALGGEQSWAMGIYLVVTTLNVAVIHLLQTSYAGLEAERRRSADLAAGRELLFHELQHRVGNNLQMVGSLLALQGRRVEAGPARDAVEEAARRVRLVGRIQRTLYEPGGTQRSLAGLLGPVVRDIVDSSQDTTVEIRLDVEEDVLLPAEHAIPVALIVSEAVSNALEHGFGAEGRGLIGVRITREEVDHPAGMRRLLAIVVEDDGCGLPEGFDAKDTGSLGLRIARSLAHGLGGDFSLRPGIAGGTVSHLRIPIPEPREASTGA